MFLLVGTFFNTGVNVGSFNFDYLNMVSFPVIVVDEKGEILFINKAFEESVSLSVPSGTSIEEVFNFDKKSYAEAKKNESQLKMQLKAEGVDVSFVSHIRISEVDGDIFYFLTLEKEYNDIFQYPELLDYTMEETPASLIILDQFGIFIYSSSRFEELSGYERSELKNKSIEILKTDESVEGISDKLKETVSLGAEWSGELCNRKKNGEIFWSLVRIKPLIEDSGEVRRFIIFQEDITYLKNIESELKRSEEKFSLLFNTLPEGVAVTDLSGMVTQVNDAYLKLYSLHSDHDIVGKSIFSILRDEEVVCISNLMDTALNSGFGEIRDFESEQPGKQFFDIEVTLMKDQFGQSIGFVVITVDITKKIIAERALRESEARNRALIEAVPDIMFRVNNEGVYLDKMLGNKIDDVFPQEVAAKNVMYISKAIQTREIQIHEYRIDRGRGEEYYEARFIAIEDDEVLVILRDVTDRSKAMNEIEKARHEAELANRSKSDFLANMSHEIRTPLNSITGFIELLLRTDVNDSQKDFLNTIRRSAATLLQIINDILDFSKIESNKLEISHHEFNPFVELESVISLFDVKAKEKGIHFLAYIDPAIPLEITGDPLRLKQILGNLLSNAIKFTPQGEYILAEIKLKGKDEGLCRIEFSVQDTGIGIAETKQKKIFEAFSQADGSVTRQYGGTGLGLSISQNLASLLGGELKLESKKGVGSRFFFEVSCTLESDQTLADSLKQYSDKSISFCCSDNEYFAGNILNYLRRLPLSLYETCDIHDQVCHDSDLTFVMNSAENREAFISNEMRGQKVKSVFVSSSDEMAEMPFSTAVFNSVLTFPVKPSDLIEIVEELLGGGPRKNQTEFKEEEGRPHFRGTVLVGEDNRINQKLIRLLLKDYGLTIDIAGNGLDVYEMYKKKNYDLVFMDMHMPIADGFESAFMIREYERDNKIESVPIVALTAKALKGDREFILENGMDGYLSKPIVIEEFEKVLRKYLEESGGAVNKESVQSKDEVKPNTAKKKNIPDVRAKSEKYDIDSISSELMVPVDMLQEIAEDFFSDAAEIISGIKKEIGALEYDSIYHLSHKLKGAAANLRFKDLSHLALKIEENSSMKNKEFDYSGIIDTIENELQELQSVIKRGKR